MKITHLLATLLLISTCATQASAYTRAYKNSHHAYVRTHGPNRGMPLARSRLYNSYANGPTVLGPPIERRPTAQYQSPPAAPKDDWPANMILDSFQSREMSSAGTMAAPFVI
jgi:hypothetical protein